jgi:hypothetical protein
VSTGGFYIEAQLVELAQRLHDACESVDRSATAEILDQARAHLFSNNRNRDAAAYWIGTMGACVRRSVSEPVIELLEHEISACKAWQQHKQS